MSAAPTALLAAVPSPEPKPFFSDAECGCGCQNLIPLIAYERGWRYLRGHKPATLIRAPKKAPVISATNPRKMMEFFDAELANNEKQTAAAEVEHRALSDKISAVRGRIEKLRADSQATKRLRAEVEQFFRARAEKQ